MRPSYTKESDFRQQRDFGQKFSATFEFIGVHWRGLGRALLIIVLPAALLQGILTGLLQNRIFADTLRNGSTMTEMTGRLAAFNAMRQSPFYWVNTAMGGVLITLMVLTVYGYMRRCLQLSATAGPIGVGEVWAEVKSQFLSSFLSYFGLLIIVIIGLFFLAVPGIYLAIVFSLFYVVKVMEQTGFRATASRCLQLVRGKWWSTFGLLFIIVLALFLMLSIGGGILGFIGAKLGLIQTGSGTNNLALFGVIALSIGSLFNMVIYPVLLIALAFQYFNLVERHDGVGLRNMVSQLGQAPAAVQNAAYQPDEEGEY